MLAVRFVGCRLAAAFDEFYGSCLSVARGAPGDRKNQLPTGRGGMLCSRGLWGLSLSSTPYRLAGELRVLRPARADGFRVCDTHSLFLIPRYQNPIGMPPKDYC